jgi:hypothetical protein
LLTQTSKANNSSNAWGDWEIDSEGFDVYVVALSSDVAASFFIWSSGYGPTYYGLEYAVFTFFNATFKYSIREKINDCVDDYFSKHLIAGAVGGGSYYGVNYLSNMLITGVSFNSNELIKTMFKGFINNSMWEFLSEQLKTLKNQDEWPKYTVAIWGIESFDCLFDEDMMKCIFYKQSTGAASRMIGAYISKKSVCESEELIYATLSPELEKYNIKKEDHTVNQGDEGAISNESNNNEPHDVADM